MGFKHKISGTVIEIGELKTFGSGFKKRSIVVADVANDTEQNEKRHTYWQIDATRDEIMLLDAARVGAKVSAEVWVGGRKWQRDGEPPRYFLSMELISLIVVAGGKEAKGKDETGGFQNALDDINDALDGDLPF